MQCDKLVGTAAAITSPGENKIANSLVDTDRGKKTNSNTCAAHMVNNSLWARCVYKVVKYNRYHIPGYIS